MRDDDNGALLLQTNQKILDFGGGDRIERGAGLIEEENFRIHRKGAGNTQTLLLAAGECVGRLMKFVFDFFPQCRPAQASLD